MALITAHAQEKVTTEKCRYIKTAYGYLMVLREGDDVLANIENLAKEKQIPSANLPELVLQAKPLLVFLILMLRNSTPKHSIKSKWEV